MSKIALTPNASGAGTLTIAAPNTNVDRTLTLPDATGTVVLNEGSGTFSIRPSGSVQIGSTTGANPQLFVYANSSTEPSIQVRQDGSAAIQIWAGLSGVERMRIDSAGRVTMPYQPAFDVGYSPTGYSTLGDVVFNTVFVNVGGHYSTSSGRFTAPVAGSYFFYTSQIKNTSNAVARRRFDKNGAPATASRHLRLDEGQLYGDNGALVSIIYLNAGDYVTVDQFAGSSYGTLEYDYFGGYLIG